jgi:hypothetical protein
MARLDKTHDEAPGVVVALRTAAGALRNHT